MKYKALRESYDSARFPAFCAREGVYEFDKDPGKHFVSLEPAKKESVPTELLSKAEELGISVDKRWSEKRLMAEIEKAETEDLTDGDE